MLAKNVNAWSSTVSVLQVLLYETAEIRNTSGNASWMPRSFRYILEDFVKHCDPSRVVPKLIPVSDEASKKIDRRGGWSYHQKAGLTYEHAVPLSTLFNILMNCRHSKSRIEKAVKKFFFITWVTDEEDRKLNDLGLRSAMPDGWVDSMCPRARYDAAGIVLQNTG